MEQQTQQRELSEDIEINLSEILHLFRQKLKGIVLLFIIGGLVAGLFTFFFITPKYQATSKLYIVSASNESGINYSDVQVGSSLTADYQQLITSPIMLERVNYNLGLDLENPSDLKNMVSISNPSSTRILQITATSEDPATAKKIANELARLAVTDLPKIMESNPPHIVEEAVLPTAKASPSYTKNIVLGALLFTFIYLAILVINFLRDDTIHTAEEFEHYFGIVPLSVVPEAEGYGKKANVKQKRNKAKLKNTTHREKKGARLS